MFGLHTETRLYFDILTLEKKEVTLLIYLNDNFVGEETVFYVDDVPEPITIKPQKGMALLFDISLWHKDSIVREDETY